MITRTTLLSYDAVLDESATQEDVFAAVGMERLITNVIRGYNGTVVAYGQTGSGKTYTMEGFVYKSDKGKPLITGHQRQAQSGPTSSRGSILKTPKMKAGCEPPPKPNFNDTSEEHYGISIRAIRRLYDQIKARPDAINYSISVSFLQIYREKVYDLLSDIPMSRQLKGGDLKVRWRQQTGFFVSQLSKHHCGDSDEALQFLQNGVQNRIVANHRLNAASSRSHCIYKLQVVRQRKGKMGDIVSALTLVDLAGSERLRRTQTQGKQFKESVLINKSLAVLLEVIDALAAQKGHVPYRDSTLTKLLENGIGGDSYSAMVACIAPCDSYYEENTSTLQYATQTKKIKTTPNLGENSLTTEMKKLKKEVKFLKSQLQHAALQYITSADTTCSSPAADMFPISGRLGQRGDFNKHDVLLIRGIHGKLIEQEVFRSTLIDVWEKDVFTKWQTMIEFDLTSIADTPTFIVFFQEEPINEAEVHEMNLRLRMCMKDMVATMPDNMPRHIREAIGESYRNVSLLTEQMAALLDENRSRSAQLDFKSKWTGVFEKKTEIQGLMSKEIPEVGKTSTKGSADEMTSDAKLLMEQTSMEQGVSGKQLLQPNRAHRREMLMKEFIQHQYNKKDRKYNPHYEDIKELKHGMLVMAQTVKGGKYWPAKIISALATNNIVVQYNSGLSKSVSIKWLLRCKKVSLLTFNYIPIQNWLYNVEDS